MDWMSRINDRVFNKEANTQRRAREAHRTEVFTNKIRAALGKKAQGWNVSYDRETMQEGRPVGSNHPSVAAMAVVRAALDEFHLPKVQLEFKKTERTAGTGSHGISEGKIWIAATLTSNSGPKHYVDIPVVVHDGRILSPSILVHQGTPRVLTQHAFDDILKQSDFKADIPDRRHMFTTPGPHATKGQYTRQFPGVYTVPERMRAASKKDAFYGADVFGINPPGTGAEVPGADGTHIDVGERSTEDMLGPGQSVRLTKDIVARERGGVAWQLKSGLKGEVIRDCDGANRAYYVRLDGFGVVLVAREALK